MSWTTCDCPPGAHDALDAAMAELDGHALDAAAAERIADDVRAMQRLAETVEHVAVILAHTGHHALGERLTADWAAAGMDPEAAP